jgi:hypothetical protein
VEGIKNGMRVMKGRIDWGRDKEREEVIKKGTEGGMERGIVRGIGGGIEGGIDGGIKLEKNYGVR